MSKETIIYPRKPNILLNYIIAKKDVKNDKIKFF
nr:MAG TPA: hypothetical protein [Caudoviricetes sp.]